MLLLYYPPHPAATDEQMLDQSVTAIRQYAEDLCDFSEDQLREGWRETRRSHRTRAWPLIATILDNCSRGKAAANSRNPGRYREASPDEQEYQRVAYGEVRMPWVRDCDVNHHRRDFERKKAGEKTGFNPFAGRKVSA